MYLQDFKKQLLNGLFALLKGSESLRQKLIGCPMEEEKGYDINESMDFVDFLQDTTPIRADIQINVGKVLHAFVFPEPVCEEKETEMPLVPSSMFEVKTFLIDTLDSLSRLSSMIFDKKCDATKIDTRQCENTLELEFNSIIEILDECNRECAAILDYCTIEEDVECESGESINEKRRK